MLIDGLIVLFAISALYRGIEIGFIRQFGSTAGFFGGLFIGAALEPHTVRLVHGANNRGVVTILTTLGCALVLLLVGEYLGIVLKKKLLGKHINKLDNGFGAVLSIGSVLLSVWLVAAIINSLPFPNIQSSIRSSRIITSLNRSLPSAPSLISSLGRLIDPNGFPNVFIGGEPNPSKQVPLPSLGELAGAVNKDRASVVKFEGQGCGGIVEGSGFVVGNGYVATNAHVVAGIKHPYVQDANGTHSATPVWFDPNLDLAVLRVSNLAGKPLSISNQIAADNSAAAVLGYPGGGPFTAGPAAVLSTFTASGRNIYGRGSTERSIYELQADIIPGNSGGPVVDKQGRVIGLVFAESTTYNHIGYALTSGPVLSAIDKAEARGSVVSTGSCAEN